MDPIESGRIRASISQAGKTVLVLAFAYVISGCDANGNTQTPGPTTAAVTPTPDSLSSSYGQITDQLSSNVLSGYEDYAQNHRMRRFFDWTPLVGAPDIARISAGNSTAQQFLDLTQRIYTEGNDAVHIFSTTEATFFGSLPLTEAEVYRITTVKQRVNELNQTGTDPEAYFLAVSGVPTYNFATRQESFLIYDVTVGVKSQSTIYEAQAENLGFAQRQITDMAEQDSNHPLVIPNHAEPYLLSNSGDISLNVVPSFQIGPEGRVQHLGFGVTRAHNEMQTFAGGSPLNTRVRSALDNYGACFFVPDDFRNTATIGAEQYFLPLNYDFNGDGETEQGGVRVCVLKEDRQQSPELPLRTASISLTLNNMMDSFGIPGVNLVQRTFPDGLGDVMTGAINSRTASTAEVTIPSYDPDFYYGIVAVVDPKTLHIDGGLPFGDASGPTELDPKFLALMTLASMGATYLGLKARRKWKKGEPYRPTTELLTKADHWLDSLNYVYEGRPFGGFAEIDQFELMLIDMHREFQSNPCIKIYLQAKLEHFVRSQPVEEEAEREEMIHDLSFYLNRALEYKQDRQSNNTDARVMRGSIYREAVEGYFLVLRDQIRDESDAESKNRLAVRYKTDRDAVISRAVAFQDIVNILRDSASLSRPVIRAEYQSRGNITRDFSVKETVRAAKEVTIEAEAQSRFEEAKAIAPQLASAALRIMNGDLLASDLNQVLDEITGLFQQYPYQEFKQIAVNLIAERIVQVPDIVNSQATNHLFNREAKAIAHEIALYLTDRYNPKYRSRDVTYEEGFKGDAKRVVRRKLVYLQTQNPELGLRLSKKEVVRWEADNKKTRIHAAPIVDEHGNLFQLLFVVTDNEHN
jgi:hypothetical protein